MAVDPVTLLAAVVCGAICVRIVTYRRGKATYRMGVSLCAYVLAAGSGAQSVLITFSALLARPVPAISPWLLMVLVVILVLTVRANGNVARIWRLG
ncbi:phage holin family protein [Pseudomonas nitroreducens]|uniref:Phage holin family protein n=1 Tax=Pseudomonas nitroreducens TaxID=46680 RepID=A0ABS0KVH1_PSENT|nr:phage holin family protein [Pseudomonas nitroreducens]MBG6292080.1 phage holin family protein [Pseudomonas nitroreducens]